MTTQAQNPPPGTPSRWLRRLCWALAVLGAAAPWYFNLRYFATGGSVAPGVFFADASANALTTAEGKELKRSISDIMRVCIEKHTKPAG